MTGRAPSVCLPKIEIECPDRTPASSRPPTARASRNIGIAHLPPRLSRLRMLPVAMDTGTISGSRSVASNSKRAGSGRLVKDSSEDPPGN